MKKYILFFLLLAVSTIAFSQKKNYTISGELKDSKTGEELVGASVYSEELKSGTFTNSYGFYSLSLPAGKYSIVFSYIGYESIRRIVDLSSDQKLKIELKESDKQLKEVAVNSDKPSAKNVEQNKMSVVKLDIKEVKKIPLLLGEVDIIKAIQLLPGIQAAGDGSSNLIVRGGNIDHNLVLLDEAVVYNPSHVLGFFSVFNGDAIKDFEIYKGGIPAQYGGRLASVLDVRMKDGNSKNFSASGGIGLLSSRLTLEGPIVKNKSSFMISGRRSYFDIFFPLSSQLDGTVAYFGDLNIKLNYTLGDKDKIFLSAYYGRDNIGFGGILGFGWGNLTTTARWNHVFNSKLFMNTTVAFSRYDYNFDLNIAKNLNFTRSNYINDLNLKIDGSYYITPKSSLKFGTKQNYYVFEPGTRTPITKESIISAASLPAKRAYGQDYYASHIYKFGKRATIEYGARISIFSNIGDGRSINYVNGSPTFIDNGYVKQSSFDALNPYTNYSSGQIYKTNYGIEPRVNFTFLLNSSSSIKTSYNRMFQYMHLIQNVTASIGQEFWTPSDNYIKPQMSDQVALGYFKNFNENTLEFSVEAYYKWMSNTIELRNGADIQFNEAIEGQVIAGQGRAYGLEFFLRKQKGKTTGWVSYTLSKSERQNNNINDAKWYPFRFDRTNYITLVLSHELSKRVSVGASFIYATGEAFTIATSRTNFFNDKTPSVIYGERNGSRFPDYNRLDLSLTLNQKKKEVKPFWYFKKRAFEGSWVFSLYNAYGRKNAYTLQAETNDQNVPIIYKWYLFTYVPAVTYNFKF